MTDNSIKLPKDALDILPKNHQYVTYFKKVVRHRCRQAGYRRFTTPVFESMDLVKLAYNKSDSDLDDHYCFKSKNGGDMCLVKDRTLSSIRSYIENGMKEWPQPVELYCIEPVFYYDIEMKYEHLQAQRFGVDVLGETDPAIDTQVIQLASQILDDLGIRHLFKLRINNVGSQEDKQKYATALQDYFIGKERYLGDEGVKLLHSDPLRLLSIDNEDVQILVELAPKYEQFLSKESIAYFEKLQEFLKEVGIDFEVDTRLFLDAPYYTHCVFQFDSTAKIEGPMCKGGRYDGLAKQLGHEEDIAGFGFGMNIDGVIQVMRKEKIIVPSKDDLHVFVAQLGDGAKKKCLRLISELRDAGVKGVGALGKGSMKEQLRLAQQFRVPYTVLMGTAEVKAGEVIIRHMQKGTQSKVPYDKAVEEVSKLIGEENLDTYHPGELVYG